MWIGGNSASAGKLWYWLLASVTVLHGAGALAADENYEFERMWPTLQQPWYFNSPMGLATDTEGSVYVADGFNNRIQKFTLSGQFITLWGGEGSDDGQLDLPQAVAVYGTNRVYVADTENHRVQVFTGNGGYLDTWGKEGTAPGEFQRPAGIAVDDFGLVYMTDLGTHRIQKFSDDGTVQAEWGGPGTEDGMFDEPRGIVVDEEGYLYVVDSQNHRVQKLDSDGDFVDTWGTEGTGEGQFQTPQDIALDADGNVLVTDAMNYRVQRFTRVGEFLSEWGQEGSAPGEFAWPDGIAVGTTGRIYVADRKTKDCIHVFSSAEQVLDVWGSQLTGPNQFNGPTGLAFDEEDNLYIADYGNSRVQVLDADGAFVESWRGEGEGSPSLVEPYDLAADLSGHIYVANHEGPRIHKFTLGGEALNSWPAGALLGMFVHVAARANSVYVSVADPFDSRINVFDGDGNPMDSWGSTGSGPGQLSFPWGLDVDGSGLIYVADSGNHRIQVFGAGGTPERAWGSYGSEPGQFDTPYGVSVDGDRVFVSERGNHRVQSFTLEGDYVTSWGTEGTGIGQFQGPDSVASLGGSRVIVADSINNRLQEFARVSVPRNAKAVVVAGGGPFPGNNIWDATEFCANFAYRALLYQGYTKQDIHYLSSDLYLDLDNNGEPDDVDDDATNTALAQSLEEWALGADSLVVYLVDHGGDEAFRMSGTETLAASDLDAWLDAVEPSIGGPITVVYDACQSGSFISIIGGPNRIVVASADAAESAYFLSTGTISFSNFFWTHIFSGYSIQQAYDVAAQALRQTIPFQSPQLSDPDSLAPVSYIGNGAAVNRGAPLITGLSERQSIEETNTASFFADVEDADGIARVWAVIWPPGFDLPSPDNPVRSLPSFDLTPAAGLRWEGAHGEFNSPGTHTLAFYARDRIGNTSAPAITSVSVANPLRRRAVLVAGGSADNALWPAYERSYALAYAALRTQGYANEDLYVMAHTTVVESTVNLPSLENLETALGDWAGEDTQDLTLYMVGPGGDGLFQLSLTQTLGAVDLAGLLTDLRGRVPGVITVVYDACRAGSFLPSLTVPEGEEQIVLASAAADESARFLSSGELTFSKFFWVQILNGATVGQAFEHASLAMSFAGEGQTGQRDDTGNGIANEAEDGPRSNTYYLGIGLGLGADTPLVGSGSEDQTLGGGVVTAPLWADGVTSVGSIGNVWAAITPPGWGKNADDDCEPLIPLVELSPVGGGRYEGAYDWFTDEGVYRVAIHAMDEDGNVSLPWDCVVAQSEAVDVRSPEVTAMSPAAGSVGIAQRPRFSLLLSDDLSGVDTRSLALTVEGADVSHEAVREGTLQDLEVTYVPVEPLGLGDEVVLTLNAVDLAGNVMEGFTASFSVTDGVDENEDGMPNDWAELYGLTDPEADPDEDGASNAEEAGRGTDPLAFNNTASEPDAYEDDDTTAEAAWVHVDAPVQQHSFHDLADRDWVQFYTPADEILNIHATQFGAATNARIEIFEDDGTTLISSDAYTSTGTETHLIWTVETEGFYHTRLTNYPQTAFGTQATYDLTLTTDSGPSPGVGDVLITVEEAAASHSPIANATVGSSIGNILVHGGRGRYLAYNLPSNANYTFTVTAAPGYDVAGASTVVPCTENRTATGTIRLAANEGPEADFSAEPTTGSVPLTVAFSDHSTPGTAEITSWAWDFGDGETGSGRNPEHTYSEPGTYSVRLQVATAVGEDEEVKADYIAASPSEKPTAQFTGAPRSGPAPLTVDFSDQSGQGTHPIVSWTWGFGDGATSTELNPEHVYTEPGVYEVMLTVVSAAGYDTRAVEAYITVTDTGEDEGEDGVVEAEGDGDGEGEGAAEGAGSGEPPLPGEGEGAAEGAAAGEAPPSGEGEGAGETPQPGEGAGDGEGEGQGPTAAFEASPVYGAAPLSVQFQDESLPGDASIVSWVWSFGDSNTDTGQNPEYVYDHAGEFSVTLTVVTALGADEENKTDYISVREAPGSEGESGDSEGEPVEGEGDGDSKPPAGCLGGTADKSAQTSGSTATLFLTLLTLLAARFANRGGFRTGGSASGEKT